MLVVGFVVEVYELYVILIFDFDFWVDIWVVLDVDLSEYGDFMCIDGGYKI